MGITIVRKSKPGEQRLDAKTALVLSGGAISGGSFKMGGLKALNDFLINRKVTDFDMYVGASAGAILAAGMANGVGPEEMFRSLEGRSQRFTQLKPWDFYTPNIQEFVQRPIDFLGHMFTFFPSATLNIIIGMPQFQKEVRRAITKFFQNPNWSTMEAVLEPIAFHIARNIDIPNPLNELVPSGPFSNHRLEKYVRENIQRNQNYQDFSALKKELRKELYVVAMDLDTAERAIFGPGEIEHFTISQAVQASTALPGFYAPVQMGDAFYVDGGIRKTANIDVAVSKGADLIIVYNPFRPIVNSVVKLDQFRRRQLGLRSLKDEGMFTVLNQVVRTLLHTRLHLALDQYRKDRKLRSDIIVLEPTANDHRFFNINPLSFWLRTLSAQEGFRSTMLSIERRFDELRSIFSVYGIEMSRHFVREELRRLKLAQDRESKMRDVLESEVPKRDIRVAQ